MTSTPSKCSSCLIGFVLGLVLQSVICGIFAIPRFSLANVGFASVLPNTSFIQSLNYHQNLTGIFANVGFASVLPNTSFIQSLNYHQILTGTFNPHFAEDRFVLNNDNPRKFPQDQCFLLTSVDQNSSVLLKDNVHVNFLGGGKIQLDSKCCQLNKTCCRGKTGSMCNNMVQYIHAFRNAQIRGNGLVDSQQGNLEDFGRLQYKRAPGKTISSGTLCGGAYAQSYFYLGRNKKLAKCLFSPYYQMWKSIPIPWYPKHGIQMGPADVVIHMRSLSAELGVSARRPYSDPPLEYYTSILSKINFHKVYIISTPSLYKYALVTAIQEKFGAQIYRDSAPGDFSFALMAPTFIGSFGTFSWTVALLSEGSSIHLPYCSDRAGGADWLPWDKLFIHDDNRILYHDTAPNQKLFRGENATAVASRNTAFAKSIRSRRDPCPNL